MWSSRLSISFWYEFPVYGEIEQPWSCTCRTFQCTIDFKVKTSALSRQKGGRRTVWERLGNFGRALAGFPTPIVRPSAFLSRRPPPPPPHRPFTTVYHITRLENAHRAFQQERWRTLQIFDMSKTISPTLCVRRRPPTTTNELQRHPTFVCVLPPFHER